MTALPTVWVLGDQLNRRIGALAEVEAGRARVLLVESRAKLASKPFHRQRFQLVLASMRRFADDLRAAGFEVDHRVADSLVAGLAAHRATHRPSVVRATEPLSRASHALLLRHDVELVRSNQFLCHYEDFATWADAQRGRLTMEAFYRWRRAETGYLMDGDRPAGGRWNLDAENREPPPRFKSAAEAEARWPSPVVSRLDDVDADVVASLPDSAVGASPTGVWATTRRGALARLRHFVADVLPRFGPHEDAITEHSWHLAHSLLSPYLNIGLLMPDEVLDAVEVAYRAGDVPLASAEGFVRQILGWREYVWGLYWWFGDSYGASNSLAAHRPLPPAFTGAATQMRCLAHALDGVHARGWTHHIQRLMVIGNLNLLAGVDPAAVVDWMWAGFVDGSEWVMVPNVVGMSLHADGGRMATKPYAGGGAYLNRMSDHCKGCRYDPKKRVGDDACPFTTLYWDFIARHRDRFAENHRMAQPVKGLDRLGDLPAVRARAADVLDLLDAGEL